jgi:acetyltransferase-like isoleucine patch superfamily enzyme
MQLPTLARILAVMLSRLYYPLRFKSFGARSILERPLLLTHPSHILIGSQTSIRRGVRLEVVPSLAGNLDAPEISIGSRCLIEQNVQIIARRRVCIGSDVSIAGHCAIVDVIHPYDIEGPLNIGYRIHQGSDEVHIEEGCFIGFGSVVLPGVRLGQGCVVGANSVVTKSFGPRTVLAGSPARAIKTY